MAGKSNNRQPTNAIRGKRVNRLRNALAFSTSATSYRGPISIPTGDQSVVSLMDNATVTTSMAGGILITLNNNPSNARNWTEYSTSWSEYRVLGIKIIYDPYSVVNTATVPGFNGYQSVVHTLTAPAPASMAQAASTGVSKPWNAFRRFVREWRMSDPEEALFQPTASPAATAYAFCLYGDTGGATVFYGNVSIEYLIQFKTHTL